MNGEGNDTDTAQFLCLRIKKLTGAIKHKDLARQGSVNLRFGGKVEKGNDRN